jgi:hypothetical protein
MLEAGAAQGGVLHRVFFLIVGYGDGVVIDV